MLLFVLPTPHRVNPLLLLFISMVKGLVHLVMFPIKFKSFYPPLFLMITFDVSVEPTDLKNQEAVTITFYVGDRKVGSFTYVRNQN